MHFLIFQRTLYSYLSYLQVDFSLMQNRKLAISSIEFILVVLYKKELKFTLEVEEAEKCASIIFTLVDSLSANIKNFERERTLTATIFHQMMRYYFLSSTKLIYILEFM